MQSLLDTNAYTEIVNRINKLTPQTASLWGKMNVAQMLAHCNEGIKVPLNITNPKRMFIGRIIGGFVKPNMVNDKPWKKSMPTAPSFEIVEAKNFEKEKLELINYITEFNKTEPNLFNGREHPFFGKLN